MSLDRVSQRHPPLPAPLAAEGRDDTAGPSTPIVLVVVCAAVVLVRLVYAALPLRSDEAGYLMAVRHWAPGAGQFVYGDYHVDRPPLLMAIYRVAAMWESDAAIRVLTIPFVMAGVLALARAGYLLAGVTAARWSAAVGAALLCNPALAGDQADGELFATAFVAVSVAATLQAWNAPRQAVLVGHGALAGALAAAATLVKQNFLDAFVFAAALLIAHSLHRRRTAVRALTLAGSGTIGAVAVAAAAAAWVFAAGIDPARMWLDLVEFRGEALDVITRGSLRAPATRAARLLLFALLSLAVPIGWLWVRWRRSAGRGANAERTAVTALLVFAMCSIGMGGSFWPHYLLQAVTPIALAAGLVVATRPSGTARQMRRLAQASVASTLLGVAVMVAGYAVVPLTGFPQHIGQWLKASAEPTDTAFVAYGYPGVLESADLASPYPYLWSLPMRTSDPDQDLLRRTLSGPGAPTWVVQINSLDSWGIDRGGRLSELIEARYEHVADVCGHAVYLREGITRDLEPVPSC